MDELKWLVGSILGVVALVGGVVARDRQVAKVIRDGDDKLHERLNRVRDDLNDNFVRRSDLDGHLQRIDDNVKDLREEIRASTHETNRRLDTIVAAVSNGKT